MVTNGMAKVRRKNCCFRLGKISTSSLFVYYFILTSFRLSGKLARFILLRTLKLPFAWFESLVRKLRPCRFGRMKLWSSCTNPLIRRCRLWRLQFLLVLRLKVWKISEAEVAHNNAYLLCIIGANRGVNTFRLTGTA